MQVDVVAGDQRFPDRERRAEVVAEGAERRQPAVELAELAIGVAGREDAGAIRPGRAAAGDADAGQVFLRKPDVVADAAAVDRQQLA